MNISSGALVPIYNEMKIHIRALQARDSGPKFNFCLAQPTLGS